MEGDECNIQSTIRSRSPTFVTILTKGIVHGSTRDTSHGAVIIPEYNRKKHSQIKTKMTKKNLGAQNALFLF